MQKQKIVVIGGGAAGYFFAINLRLTNKNQNVIILERSNNILAKVKVSGGGRCNVTNIISQPDQLIDFYPRGGKELLGPFHRFTSADIIKWFNEKGVKLKTEPDGRIFPESNTSQTIIDCFLNEADSRNVILFNRHGVEKIVQNNNRWIIKTSNEKEFESDYLVICTGSSDKIWNLLKQLGHNIISPVPSLFTFNISDKLIAGLAGVSINNVTCSIEGFNKTSDGPILITHWGLSGPAILKLSSLAARYLHDKKYHFKLMVNWLPGMNINNIIEHLHKRKKDYYIKKVHNDPLFNLPSRFWERLALKGGISGEMKWKDVPNNTVSTLSSLLSNSIFNVTGKSTFKEEFVSAGGVDLKEINFKTMESRLHKNLFFAGEVLNIDALTGGFNFQAAWTTAWIAAETISERIT
jgi:predicted Rossmann fold flavoprotein